MVTVVKSVFASVQLSGNSRSERPTRNAFSEAIVSQKCPKLKATIKSTYSQTTIILRTAWLRCDGWKKVNRGECY